MQSNECPDHQTMDLVHSGKLASADLDIIEQHIEKCEACSQYLNSKWTSHKRRSFPKQEKISVPLWVKTWAEHGLPKQLPRLNKPIVEGDIGSLGKYRLLTALGNGTSSIVYHGFDTVLHRNVTIKVFRPGYIRNGINDQAAVEEARAIAQFDNSLVVGILDIGKEGATDYLVLPYTNGTALNILLKSADFHGLPLTNLLTLAHDIAMGLRTIHEHGLCHRDLKPSNIIAYVAPDGKIRARLIDLGLSNCPELKAGTEGYMAPELKKNTPPTAAADLYSLGCVLNDMALVSDRAWPRELMKTIHDLLKHDPSQRPSLATVISVIDKRLPPRTALVNTGLLVLICLAVIVVCLASLIGFFR